MTIDTSVILKGLTPLVKPSTDWLGKKIIGKEILERRQLKETALQPILQKAAEDIAEIIEPIGEARIDQICLFLTSNEAEAIIRQIYAASILESKSQNLEQIQQEFLKAFSLYTNIPEVELKDSAPAIFNTLVTGCEETLSVAIDRGRLSAHEAKSVFRHQVLLDEIATVNKNLEFLIASQELDIKAILEFEQKYRQQVRELHGKLTPPYIDIAKKIPIEELYVSPTFSQEIFNRNAQENSKTKKDFYGSIHRTVLLGNPGGGKSTCAQKFCYDLVTQYSERLLNSRQVTPILIILRDYGVKKKNINCSLLEFIELTAKTKYQLQPPSTAFNYLLLNGRVTVIFDGLDELTETSYRQEIRNDVELFCNLYPSVPVLLTSREIGYKEAPLDESKFEVCNLEPFEDQQVAEYVTKWFAIDKELTAEQQKEKVAAFLTESKNLTDLRSNPLMLGLMCNIYKGDGYIPRNRPDVYRKCAEMLFERWDRGRNIQLPSLVKQIESKIRPLMMYLANWIYTDESLQSGVTEQRLIAKSADYLCEKHFTDRDDAECAAKAFIHFCRGRAWVFTNVGTNKHDEELYQFTHRTFLEYFTAAYLNRIHRTPDKLFDFLLPRIAKQEWDVVSQLAFQIQNRNFEDAGDELLNYLLEEIERANNETKWNLLYFAVKCLEFIAPNARIVNNIVSNMFDNIIQFGVFQIQAGKIYYMSSDWFKVISDIIESLHKSTNENYHNIIACLYDYTNNNLNQLDIYQGSIFLELLKDLNNPLISEKTKKDILIDCQGKIREIAQEDLFICILYRKKYKISLLDIQEWHGIDSFFYDYRCRINPDMGYCSIAFGMFQAICHEVSNNHDVHIISEASKLGTMFLGAELPLIDCKEDKFSIFAEFDKNTVDFFFEDTDLSDFEDEIFSNLITNNCDAIFGGYVIFAVYLESYKYDRLANGNSLYQEIQNTKIPFFKFIRYIFLARFEILGKYDRKIEAELDKCNFNQEQREFICQWVKREIDLVAIPEEA